MRNGCAIRGMRAQDYWCASARNRLHCLTSSRTSSRISSPIPL